MMETKISRSPLFNRKCENKTSFHFTELLANSYLYLQIYLHMDPSTAPVTVTITLDKRRQKKNGTFPVKLYVWDSGAKKGKYYGTRISLTTDEFEGAWEFTTTKPRDTYKRLHNTLKSLRDDAQEHIDRMEHFTFEAFERKAQTPKGEAQNVFWHYAKRVDEMKAAKQIGTGNNYSLAAKSLKEYAGADTLLFKAVTPKFLQGFEDHMVNKGRTLTTVSMYVRTLRTIYNDAIAANDAKVEDYPFGRRKYVVPASSNKKKALTRQQLRALLDAPAATPEQERARAFFYFSYASNGMNMKDIALLKWSQVEADRFTFTREKTKRTKKDKQAAITVFLTEYHRDIISRYGNDPKGVDYVFPIVSEDMDADKRHRAINNFTTYVNQHIKKLCKANDLPTVTTYWARHSFATVAVLKGASMEFMRESLGHSDMKTTLNYFAGFDDEAKKELAVSIMDF
jgi:integrase/recombinase XerD